MTADDVAYAVDWQRRAGFRLDLVFNGAGSVAADAGHGTDPLTAELTAARDEFGWINHTWSHKYLGCVRDMSTTPWSCARVPLLGWTRFVSGWAIESEIDRNIDFARQHGLPIDPTELVTGEHSGLRAPPQMVDDNPRLAGALQAIGIRTLPPTHRSEERPRVRRRRGDSAPVPHRPGLRHGNDGRDGRPVQLGAHLTGRRRRRRVRGRRRLSAARETGHRVRREHRADRGPQGLEHVLRTSSATTSTGPS
jgi:hypothetical protein